MNLNKINLKKCAVCGGKGEVIDLSAVGKELRELREAAGFSCREVADAMGIGKSYLSLLELCQRDWTPELESDFRRAVAKLSKSSTKTK